MRKQNPVISFLQVFGIVLVVAGHSVDQLEINLITDLNNDWLHLFRMPLFMFLSGYLLYYGLRKRSMALSAISLYGSQGFIWKKVRRLLIPYVFISTLAFFPKAVLSRFALRPIELSLENYLHSLIYPWDNVIRFFWFLPTLFIIFLIVVYGAKILAKLRISAPWFIALSVLLILHLFNPLKDIRLFNIGGVVEYLIYFGLGYYYCHAQVEKLFKPYALAIFCMTALVSLSLSFLASPFPGRDVLIAISGIGMCIALGHIYVREGWTCFNHLNGASYAIYLFSWFPQAVSLQILMKLTGEPWPVTSLLAFVSGVYVPWLIYRWIVRNKEKKAGKVIAYLTGQ